MADDDKTIPVLTETEKMRLHIASAGISALGAEAEQGSITTESIQATFHQLGLLDLDLPRVLNSIHLPKDAGEYATALTVIVELDAALSALDPDYVAHQVKEKYGTLRTTVTQRHAQNRNVIGSSKLNIFVQQVVRMTQLGTSGLTHTTLTVRRQNTPPESHGEHDPRRTQYPSLRT